MNKVFLIGRLCKDSEIRYTQTNIACATFDIAINNGKDSDGNERKADFIRVVVWGNQAENLAKYTHKGSQIAVDGKIQTRSYENEKGVKVYVTEVVAKQIQFLDSKKDERPLPPEPDYPTSFKSEEVDDFNFGNIDNQTQFTLNDNDLPF